MPEPRDPPAASPRRPRRRAAHGAWAGVWLVLAWLLALPAPAAEVWTATSALAVAGENAAFPTGAPTQRVALPDEWARSRPGQGGPVWYRLDFDAGEVRAPGELLALYVERACTNLEVFLNGQLVHSGGRMSEPITRNCHHAQLVGLPAPLLAPGRNTLDLKLVGHPLAQLGSAYRAGGLSAPQVGPQALLEARHDRHRALNVALPQALGATLVLMGGFMFVLGWINRSESHLAYFGALSIGWAALEAHQWLRDLPLDNGTVEFLASALLPMLTLAAVQFLLRNAGRRIRWVDIALPLQCVAMPASLVFAGPSRLYAMTVGWSVLLALQVLAAAAYHLWLQYRERRYSFWPTALLMAAGCAALALEFASQFTGERSMAAQLARIAVPLAMVLVGLRMLQQHGRALQAAQQSQAELEERVREATAEIERNYAQMAELRVERVTERERKRIAADLHDDLGAKLLTIVHTSESERISTLAREALEEMRLSVRGLTGKPVQLIDALGDWRVEVVSRLHQAGIDCDWESPSDELPQTLSARAFVQTTRILREAVSNVIKHSGATHCTVRCTLAEGDLQLAVRDNGGGIPLELDGRLDRGHGMASMKQRAKQLQGQCLVESGPGYGTVIRLTLPLDRAVEST